MNESNLDVIRRMPPEQAAEYARGVLSLLRWRPDLRKLYSTADLAFLEMAARRHGTPVRYAKEQEDDDGDLARMYAGMLNARLDADEEVKADDLDAIAEELEDSGWCIDYCDGRWEAKPCGEDVIRYTKEGDVTRYERSRAPRGGVTIGGTFYRGGQFLPDGDAKRADEGTRKSIAAASQSRKMARARRKPDAKATGERLKAHGELSGDEQKAASRSLKAMQRYHGELTAHRIDELIEQTEAAYKRSGKPELARRLAMLGHMLSQVEAPEAKQEAGNHRLAQALTHRLKPYENAELSHGDVMAGVARWAAIQKDYGEFIPEYLSETADKLIGEMQSQLAQLPKGARESRERIATETGKQLALLAWMNDRWQEENAEPEPDMGESLDRIKYAETQRGVPWTAFMLQAVADEFGIDLSNMESPAYMSPEHLWNKVKAGDYFGEPMKRALKRIPREYGTLTERQLRQVLPKLRERTDKIAEAVAA